MPHIKFDKIRKTFGDNTVIREFTADIPDNEFLVLLGPSGCGKSTMLRMIAGLTDISAGEIRFDDAVVNSLEPRERNVAFVFQSYALYPHMTVRDNIAFPLIMDRFRPWHHIPIVNSIVRRAIARRPEVSKRVEEVAAMLELENYLGRRPKTLSGGQRQRVAVARALVRDPSIYLLDEPLSNLDAKLRTQMRAEITALYKRVNKSFVYVTHDQVEAMTMATRIIVLDAGEVRQIGTPEEIYNNPADTFVARFIGSPAMNLIPAQVIAGQTSIRETGEVVTGRNARGHASTRDGDGDTLSDGDYLVGIRPEKISLAETPGHGIRGHVVAVENLGGESVVGFRFHDARSDKLLSSAALQATHYAKIPGSPRLSVGAEQWFTFDTSALSWFAEETGIAVSSAAEGGAPAGTDSGTAADSAADTERLRH